VARRETQSAGLVAFLAQRRTRRGTEERTDMVHIIFNSYWEALEFELPILREGTEKWRRWIDTALDRPHEISEWNTEKPVVGTTYRAGPRSVVVLIAGEGPMAGISNGVQSAPAEPSSRQEGVSASSFDRPVVG
jgi:pullulanase/glycogen debranching enzyme